MHTIHYHFLLLDVGDVKKVLKVLNKAMFGPAQWKDLGLSLGLYMPTLDVIGRTNGDANDYLKQTVQKWLEKGDKVTGTTWDDLIRAVKSTDNKEVAEKIQDIVKKHYRRLGNRAANSIPPDYFKFSLICSPVSKTYK